MAPRKRLRARRRTKPAPAAPAAPPYPAGVDDLLPNERATFFLAVEKLALSGCPTDFAVILVWNAGAWASMARMVLDAAVVDVDPVKKHVRLIPRPDDPVVLTRPS